MNSFYPCLPRSNLRQQIETEAISRGLISAPKRSLWPAEYSRADAEAACAFIFEHLRTLDDAARAEREFPRKAYLERLAEEWHACRLHGQPLHIEKSRRMVVSWFCTALELHLAGIEQGRFLISARKFDGANGAKSFVWRASFLYQDLRERRPTWNLAPLKTLGSKAQYELEHVTLPNGSIFSAVNSEGENFRGSGATVARIEELSQFPHVARLWGQALAVTMGAAGEPGGFAYSISNASANREYREMVAHGGL